MEQTQLQVHIQNHTLGQAITELEQERAAALNRTDLVQAAMSTNDLGVVYSYDNRKDDARDAFRAAQELSIKAADPAGQGRATGNLAQLEERAGNADEAQALYLQAADLLHEGRAFGDEYMTRKQLSKLYLTRGATLQALHETTRALGVKPNASAWDRLQQFVYRLPLQLMGVGTD